MKTYTLPRKYAMHHSAVMDSIARTVTPYKWIMFDNIEISDNLAFSPYGIPEHVQKRIAARMPGDKRYTAVILGTTPTTQRRLVIWIDPSVATDEMFALLDLVIAQVVGEEIWRAMITVSN